jgi:NADH-quinone oxidoreductase subunit M
MNLLSVIFLVPLLAAVLIVPIPRTIRWGIRLVALMATFVSMVLGLALFVKFDAATAVNGFKFDYVADWVSLPGIGLTIAYHVGVDGINLGLVVMGTIVAFAATCLSKEIDRFEKEYYILLLIMIGGILGAFVSLDIFFLYFFHELALVPTFIMIGIWGRGPDRNHATFKITLYLSLGALIALAGLVMLYLQSGLKTFDLVALTSHFQSHPMGEASQRLIFPLLMFGFCILVSLWPFHTWAPTGYAHAPTATAMLHAGVLKKFGLYGLLRIAIPMMPAGAAEWLGVLALLCLGNILYCGLVAMKQRDLNFLIGNSSVAHVGFIFLGIASLSLVGVTGAVVLMIAHGFLAALTFGLSGWLRQQTGTTEIARFGGLLRQLPFVGTFLMIAMMAGCGLPGFGNFVGEFMVLFGSWQAYPVITGIAIWSALVIGGVYMLRAIRDVLHGQMDEQWKSLRDADVFRRVPVVILTVSLLLMGIFPRLLTDKIKPDVARIVASTKTGGMAKPSPSSPTKPVVNSHEVPKAHH